MDSKRHVGLLINIIYVTDIDFSLSGKLLKFADDTKLFSVVSTVEEIELLRGDLHNSCAWAQDWLMRFNVEYSLPVEPEVVFRSSAGVQ